MSRLPVPGEKQVSRAPQRSSSPLSQCRHPGLPSSLTRVQFFARITHRHRADAGPLYGMFLSAPRSAWVDAQRPLSVPASCPTGVSWQGGPAGIPGAGTFLSTQMEGPKAR